METLSLTKEVWDVYVDGVLDGSIPACNNIKLACKRHLDDLQRSADTPWIYEFSLARARRIIKFFKYLRLTKSLVPPGKSFDPEPWQQFILVSLFGWVHKETKLRRFRKGHIMVPRKNGKSPLLAGIGLYGLVADEEMGAEIYSAATKKDQAKIIWDYAVDFRRFSSDLAGKIGKSVNSLFVRETSSKFQALSSDEEGLDGLSVHIGLVDEYQNHKTDVVYERISTSRSARRQPLVLSIGTAGVSRESPCWREHEYAANVLKGDFHDDTYFAFLAEADEGDDWEDELTWRKSNPNLGVSKHWDYMRAEAQGAKNEPAKLNAFLRLDLNIWTQQDYAWMPMDKWRKCIEQIAYKNDDGQDVKLNIQSFDDVLDFFASRWRQPFGGLDLSEKIDLTALVLLFPPIVEDPFWTILTRFFVPQDNVEKRVKNDRVPYDQWIKEGWIHATPGNVVDYDIVRAEIERINNKIPFMQLAVDPHNALQLNNQLIGAGVPVVEVQQGWKSLSDPTKELMAWVLSRKLNHLNNPVMNWMAGNLAVHKDVAGNVRPDKSKARERIDGPVALVNAMYLALSNAEDPYATRGLVTL